jgi:hypothetical protein
MQFLFRRDMVSHQTTRLGKNKRLGLWTTGNDPTVSLHRSEMALARLGNA